MKKNKSPIDALFLPFMQMMTGHHHVADALIELLQNSNPNLKCDKVDILSSRYGRIEKIISSIYLAWIKLLPNVYDKVYYKKAYETTSVKKRNYMYEMLFSPFVKRLITEKNPRIIFCTHAFPSYIVSMLKQKGQIDCLIVNVYTDFFVNNVWGIDGIDYHFVPSLHVKNQLMKQRVNEEAIFITGIPVHPSINDSQHANHTKKHSSSILITGGSLGIGPIKQFMLGANHFHYYVLCGKNDALYNYLLDNNNPNITLYRYIKSRGKMNELYCKVDGVLTKPGGVTISECLKKRKPIFIYNYLPGQEKVNMKELIRQGLVIPVSSNVIKVEKQMIDYFNDSNAQKRYEQQVDEYLENIGEIPYLF